MLNFLACLFSLIVIIWVLLFYNLSSIFWFILVTTWVVGLYISSSVSIYTGIILYLLFICVFTCLNIKSIRKKIITQHLIPYLKSQLPKISKTEEQAIDAGDVWWEGDIFSADLKWSNYRKFKLTRLTRVEQDFLDTTVDDFCKLISDWDVVTKHKDLSEQAWQYIKDHKFLALHIPKKYGGHEFSAVAHSSIVAKVASHSPTAAVSIMVPNALGPAELLLHYGTKQQKDYYLPRLASGQDIPCFALTSPYAGSDAGGMSDYGVICKQQYNGKETLGIVLNFTKRYITLAPVATVMGLAFKLYDPEGLYNKDVKSLGVTLAFIPTEYPGIEIGKRHMPMFTPFQNGPIVGKDVFIPMDFIIGGPDYIGKGWFMLMECLSGGRGISLPALSTATVQTSLLSSVMYSSIRNQFKTPIINLEGIQEKIASLAGYTFITNAMRLVTASALDHDLKPAVVSGIAKYHMTEMSRSCINSAMDIHAGKGVMNGPDNYLISHYVASPISITVEGANILTRNLIIFGQGAFRAHPFVLKELKALNLNDQEKSLHQFDKVFFKHIRFVFRNIVRLKTYALLRVVPGFRSKNIKHYKRDLSRLSAGLAFSTDIAMLIIGGKLKFNERLSARLGDVVSYIYMAICVLKYNDYLYTKTDSNYQKYLYWALDHCLYQAQNSLVEFSDNFPNKTIGLLIKKLVFPWGNSYKKPNDLADTDLVNDLLSTPDINDASSDSDYSIDSLKELTDLVYISENNVVNSNMSRLQEAFKHQAILKDYLSSLKTNSKMIYSNDIKIMLKKAYDDKLIDNNKYNELLSFAHKLDKIINVNEFESL